MDLTIFVHNARYYSKHISTSAAGGKLPATAAADRVVVVAGWVWD